MQLSHTDKLRGWSVIRPIKPLVGQAKASTQEGALKGAMADLRQNAENVQANGVIRVSSPPVWLIQGKDYLCTIAGVAVSAVKRRKISS